MHAADRAIATLAAGQHGLIARAQATRLGVTDRMIAARVAAGLWERVHRTVYRLAGHPSSWRAEVMATCLLYGSRTHASHRTAAALRGLGGIAPGPAIHLTVPRGHARRRPGVVLSATASSLHPADTEVVGGIPATAPARTLFDLAAVLPVNALEEAVDDALARNLVSASRLRWQLSKESRPGRRGIGVMRGLLAERGVGAPVHESVLETRLGRVLRRAGIRTERQFEIRDRDRFVARVDFAIPDLRIAIEADGYRWHAGRARWERDLARRNELTALGWQVIHVTTSDLEAAGNGVVAVVRAAAAARDG